MVDLSYAALASNLGLNTANPLVNAANAAGNLVCDLYEAYPTGIIPSIGNTPISTITDGLLRSLCEPRDKRPAPQQQPYSGGQCPELYKVFYGVGSQGSTPGISQLNNVSGPIRGIVTRAGVAGGGVLDVWLLVGPPRPGADVTGEIRVGTSFEPTPVFFIQSVEPNDGTDQCGNPSPVYSPTLPSPANYTDNDVNITIGGNTVSVPVTIVPTVFAPVTVFRPEINVDVGGINVNFALDGVRFSPSINIDSPITLPNSDTRPVLPPPRPQQPSVCPAVDFGPIFNRFNNVDNQLDVIEACACGPDQVLRVQNYGSANSRTVTLPSNCVGVRVIITTVGAKVPDQYGNGNAPDVLFIGWCSFGNGTPAGVRIPISHESSYFPAPERATAFSYTAVYESLARLEVLFLEDVIP